MKRIMDELVHVFWKNCGRAKGLCSLIRNRMFRYGRDVNGLEDYEAGIYSQNGEDGIFDLIFHKIGVTNKYCVEFGLENGMECNTRFLRAFGGWSGLLMDGADQQSSFIKREFITAENINDLFKKYGVPREFDLLSIDIDGNDYWVWKAISSDYSPRVVVMEYNSSLGAAASRVMKYKADHVWDYTNYYGASLSALNQLAQSKGYSLVGCDTHGVNAFFIRNDLIAGKFQVKSPQEAYYPPNHFGRGESHPPGLGEYVSPSYPETVSE